MRRRRPPEGSLTSLLDVLFILVFASLVQSQARGAVAGASAAEAAATDAVAPGAPLVPAPVVAPSFAAAREAAVAAAAKQVAGAPLVVARVGADGALVELELAGEKRPLGVPLLERVTDQDVVVAYLGDRAASLRVCGIVARELRLADLAGHGVVIAPAQPVSELPVALVSGLRRDVARCQVEQQAMAVIVEPEAAANVPTDGGVP